MTNGFSGRNYEILKGLLLIQPDVQFCGIVRTSITGMGLYLHQILYIINTDKWASLPIYLGNSKQVKATEKTNVLLRLLF